MNKPRPEKIKQIIFITTDELEQITEIQVITASRRYEIKPTGCRFRRYEEELPHKQAMLEDAAQELLKETAALGLEWEVLIEDAWFAADKHSLEIYLAALPRVKLTFNSNAPLHIKDFN